MRTMKHPQFMTFVPILLALASSSPARAAVVYVNDDAPGPAQNGSTWATAYLGIPEAIASASPGDEVWVAEVTYIGGIVLKEGVSLLGGFAGDETGPEGRDARDPSAHVSVLDGSSSAVAATIVTAPLGTTRATVLEGFTLRTGSRGVVCDASSPTIRRNVITGIYYNGILCRWNNPLSAAPLIEDNTIADNARGIYGGEYSAPVIRRNRILRNGTGMTLEGGAAMYFAFGSEPVVTGNLIAENRAGSGVVLKADGVGVLTVANNVFARNQGIGLYAFKTKIERISVIANNTFVENTVAGLRLDASRATVASNIFAFNGTGLDVSLMLEFVPAPTIRNNAVFGNTEDYTGIEDPTGTDGNLRADPQFVNRQAGDYRLCATSPLIDSGDDTYVSEGDTDLDGLPRIAGAHVDIGAYEFAYGPATLGDACGDLRVWAGLSDLTPELRARLEAAGGEPVGDVDLATAVRLLQAAM